MFRPPGGEASCAISPREGLGFPGSDRNALQTRPGSQSAETYDAPSLEEMGSIVYSGRFKKGVFAPGPL
jgi:hypothetical protein